MIKNSKQQPRIPALAVYTPEDFSCLSASYLAVGAEPPENKIAISTQTAVCTQL